MLRVIGGQAKGRLLKVPAGSKIRPTSDKVRESLFNIIGPAVINGARFIDLFAGCGAVGIEALSRGAEHAVFVESNPRHVKIIRENVERCGFRQSADIFYGDVLLALGGIIKHKPTYDIIFVDPPYDYPKWKILLSKITVSVNISDYGYLIIEHSSKVSMPEEINEYFVLYGNYIYGDTTLTVYRKRDKF